MKLFILIKNWILTLLSKRTVGVRALVVQNNQVLLVKHTYQPQWCTIGGGVDNYEKPIDAIVRELKEEVGATLNSPPKLMAVYYSQNENRDDYVIFYLVTDCTLEDVYSPEILEKKWFLLDQLPEDISPATQRRIDEYLGKRELDEKW